MITKKVVAGVCTWLFFCFPALGQHVTVTGTGHVESAVWDGTSFLLASIGNTLTPSDHDGDGRIIRLSEDGKILSPSVVPKIKLHAPKGLAWQDGVLYLTDIDRVLGIRVADGRVVFQLSFIGVASFLNDIAIRDSNTLYVSASDKGVIYQVDIRNKTYQALQIPIIAGVNGLLADTARHRLYFVSMGDQQNPGYLGEIQVNSLKVQPLLTASGDKITGSLDGLQRRSDRLYFSDWAAPSGSAPIRWFDLSTAEQGALMVRGAGQGPADFGIHDSILCLPEMKAGCVTLHVLK